jgi:integrase/recombinase XerD
MTTLREALDDYLRIRRRLGFDLKWAERPLNDFVCFLERSGAQRITIELAVMWARIPVDAHPHWWKRRLGLVRGFARYAATIDPDTEVPSTGLLPARRPRVTPYIYSQSEITDGSGSDAHAAVARGDVSGGDRSDGHHWPQVR